MNFLTNFPFDLGGGGFYNNSNNGSDQSYGDDRRGEMRRGKGGEWGRDRRDSGGRGGRFGGHGNDHRRRYRDESPPKGGDEQDRYPRRNSRDEDAFNQEIDSVDASRYGDEESRGASGDQSQDNFDEGRVTEGGADGRLDGEVGSGGDSQLEDVNNMTPLHDEPAESQQHHTQAEESEGGERDNEQSSGGCGLGDSVQAVQETNEADN